MHATHQFFLTARSLYLLELGERAGVQMPIAEHVVKVVHEGMSPEEALLSLMTRDAEPEFLGLEP